MKKEQAREQSKPSKVSSILAKSKNLPLKMTKSESHEGESNKRVKSDKQPKESKSKSNNDDDGDDRFAAMTKDPRFRSSASNDKAGGGKRIVVDERFSSMFTDEEFKSSRATVDKYGRKISKSERSKGLADLSRHYTLSEQEQERLEKLNRIARGEADGDETSSSDSSDEESDEEEEEEEASQEVLLPADLSEESSPRLAVIGCDWAHIRALDLFAVLKSFVPPTGAVLEVAVYSSEFGRKRMAAEEVDGPFSQEDAASKSDQEEVEEEEEEDLINEMGNEYDPEKLRKYEKERLLYYFAVVTCDSAETAEVLYRECDGIEFEHSAIGLDLRFIPNEIKFDASTLRDRAEDVPENYNPLDFVNKSIQQTRVQLTWDEPEHDRRKLMDWNEDGKKRKDQGIPLDELEAFIASEDDADESEDEEERRMEGVQKYRQLLTQMPFSKNTTASTKSEDQGDAEINGEEDENNPSEDEFFQDVDDSKEAKLLPDDEACEEDDGKQGTRAEKKPKKPSKHSKLFTKENQLEKDEAEGDDEDEDDERQQKKSKKKDKRKKKKKQEEEEEEPQIDVEDERFASLFTEPEFAFDRTDPKFKKTSTIKKIEEERRKRMSRKD